MSDVSEERLNYLNEVEVRFEDLNSIIDAIADYEDEVRADPDFAMYLIAERYKNELPKGQAVFSRFYALWRIVRYEQAPGWTLLSPKEDFTFTRHELIHAAAVLPLTEVDGDVGFELDSFLAKALELAESEGHA